MLLQKLLRTHPTKLGSSFQLFQRLVHFLNYFHQHLKRMRRLYLTVSDNVQLRLPEATQRHDQDAVLHLHKELQQLYRKFESFLAQGLL